MKINMDFTAALKAGLSVVMLSTSAGMQAFEVDRTHLPIAEPDPPKFKELDVRGVEAPPLFSVEAPEGAPNLVAPLIRRPWIAWLRAACAITTFTRRHSAHPRGTP
jgi:hypothetical protein